MNMANGFDRVAAAPVVGQRVRKAVSIQYLLEWAFRRECVQLQLDGREEPEGYRPGVSTIWVMMQRGNLGCKIDGGGQSAPHEDAETVAAILARLPEERGGIRMAIQIAEWARTGATPDWMPDATPRCVPAEWRNTSHGLRAKTEVIATITTRHRGRTVKRDVMCCPVTYLPNPSQIARARRAYLDWWGALHDLLWSLKASGMLRDHSLTDAMPPMKPWEKKAVDKSTMG